MSDCARQLYNACLREALKRLHRIQNTKEYQRAIRLSKATHEDERFAIFEALNEKYGFTANSMEHFGIKTRNDSKFICNHIGSLVTEKIAKRAFQSVQQLAFGKAKRVHYKRKGEFVSLEGKNNSTFLRFINGYAQITDLTIPRYPTNSKRYIRISCQFRKNDDAMNYALTKRIKFCRLICKKIKNRNIFYLQIIFAGKPFQKFELGKNITGIDIGPSTIAIVNKDRAILKVFCEDLNFMQQEKRQLQRKMERQRRASNPHKYNKNGTIKTNNHEKWICSKRYYRTKNEKAELSRKLAAKRKELHNREINQIVRTSKTVKFERISYIWFQKHYGKSVAKYAPGLFISLLKWKIVNYGGSFIEFSPFNTKLSQSCICGKLEKKPRNQRWHHCECGINVQRDLFSAFLAIFVTSQGILAIDNARNNFPVYAPLLDGQMIYLRKNKHHIVTSRSFGI